MIDTYTPTIIKNVATRIDLLRTEQNLSMRDLAKKAGISKSQLSDIILGRLFFIKKNNFTIPFFVIQILTHAG